MAELVVGANLPWLDYGQDFGANAWQPRGGLARPERRERVRRALLDLADSGASLVRWWLLGDGRAGLREDDAGRVVGLDDRFFPDVDAAIDALREAGLRAQLVLVDFLGALQGVTVTLGGDASALAIQSDDDAVLVVAEAGIELGEYSPLEVKSSVVGYGRAEKEQVQLMVKNLLGLAEPQPEDASDAIAVAICHATRTRVGRMGAGQ